MISILYIWLSIFFPLSNNKVDITYDKTGELKYAMVHDTTKIAYLEQGDGDTNLMIHGLAGSHEHFVPLINELSANARCIALDLPGYGASSKSLDLNQNVLDYFSDVILDFIKVNRLKNVNLIGHSMGGQIAIIATLKNPENIKKLTLLDPAGFETFSEQEKTLLLNTLTPAYYQNLSESQIRFAFGLNFTNMPASVENLIQKRIAFITKDGFEDYCKVISAGVKGMLAHEVINDLHSIQVPTLVVFASEDKLIPNKFLHPALTVADIAAEFIKIPDSKLVIIPNAGHMVQYEKPLEVSKQITDFINKN